MRCLLVIVAGALGANAGLWTDGPAGYLRYLPLTYPLAGAINSVWRHEYRVFASVSF